MPWTRHKGNVFTVTVRGCTAVVMRSMSWRWYGGDYGPVPGETWAWEVRGRRTFRGLAESAHKAKSEAYGAATR